MVWKYGDIHIKAGKGWTDKAGTKHSNNWMIWSDEDKKGFGLTWEDDPDTSFDSRFYWSKDVERKLADEKVVNEDGSAVIDPVTNVQQIQLGLKSQWIAQTKITANSMLNPSDWYVTRKAEADTAIPSDISTYRTAVRTASKNIEDKINACSKLADFIKLFDIPVDSDGEPTGKSPITNFPDEVN